MIMSVYLHQYVVNTLTLFGDLSDVANNILQAGADGKIEILDRPPCINRDGCGRYNVDITQQDYLELLQCYPMNSPKISIRRLLYWFVDFAVYEQLGWKITKKYDDKSERLLLKNLDKARTAIARVAVLKKNDEDISRQIESIDNLIVKLKEYLRNGG